MAQPERSGGVAHNPPYVSGHGTDDTRVVALLELQRRSLQCANYPVQRFDFIQRTRLMWCPNRGLRSVCGSLGDSSAGLWARAKRAVLIILGNIKLRKVNLAT